MALVGVIAGRALGAISPEPAGQADSAAGLSRAVAAWAEKSERPAQAYAGIAEETLQFGQIEDEEDNSTFPTPSYHNKRDPSTGRFIKG